MFCSEKEECITFFCSLHKSKVSHHHHRAPFRLLFPFGSLNYNKVCSTTATRRDFPILFDFSYSFFFLSPFFRFRNLYKSNFLTFPQFQMVPRPLRPHNQESHMHVLKPEAIKHHREKKKKYTECTYKHKKYLYIFIYLYI